MTKEEDKKPGFQILSDKELLSFWERRATCEDTIWDSWQTGEQACLCERSMGPWQLGDACKALNFPGKLYMGPLDRDATNTNLLYAAFILQHIHFYKRIHRENDTALSKQGLGMYNSVGSFT